MLSINTNTSAMAALQTLSATNSELSTTENQVSSGLKVSSALDDGASFAVAQGLRQKISAYDSVNSSLGNATSLISVTSSAVTDMSNLMSSLQDTLVSLSDNSLSTDQRSIYTDNIASTLTQLATYVNNATFNGNSLLNGSGNITFTSDTNGTAFTVRGQAVSAAVTTLTGAITTTAAITATSAQTLLTASTGAVAVMNSTINMALGELGSDNTAANNLISLNTDLQSAVTTGLGTTVDADLAKASANLTALQTKQQLGVQALSIANQSSSVILSLFRG